MLQAGTKHGFFPVYFPMSNKCLLTVKCRGGVTKYIPQSSSIEELHAIKGKKGQRGDSAWRLQVIISVIIWNLVLDVLHAGTVPVLVDANCYHYGRSRYKLWSADVKWKRSTERNTEQDKINVTACFRSVLNHPSFCMSYHPPVESLPCVISILHFLPLVFSLNIPFFLQDAPRLCRSQPREIIQKLQGGGGGGGGFWQWWRWQWCEWCKARALGASVPEPCGIVPAHP